MDKGNLSLWGAARIADCMLGVLQVLFVFLIKSFDVNKAEVAILYVAFGSLQTIGKPNLSSAFFP